MSEIFKSRRAHPRSNGSGDNHTTSKDVNMDDLKDKLNDILTEKMGPVEAVKAMAVSHVDSINAFKLHEREIADIRALLKELAVSQTSSKVGTRVIIATILASCSLVVGMIWDFNNRLEAAKIQMIETSNQWERRIAKWDFAIKRQVDKGTIQYEDFYNTK